MHFMLEIHCTIWVFFLKLLKFQKKAASKCAYLKQKLTKKKNKVLAIDSDSSTEDMLWLFFKVKEGLQELIHKHQPIPGNILRGLSERLLSDDKLSWQVAGEGHRSHLNPDQRWTGVENLSEYLVRSPDVQH